MSEKAKLRELDVDAFLVECVQILPEALNEEFVRMPSDLAYWNARFAAALRRYLEAKVALDEVLVACKQTVAEAEATAYQDCRAALLVEHSRPTESMVAAAVETHAPLLEARKTALERERQFRQALIEAEVEKAHLYGVVDAIRTKKEMLISLGAHIRAEMQHDPVLREQSRSGTEIGRKGGDE